MARLRSTGAPDVRRGISFPIDGCQRDLELIELVPLGVGPLFFRNRPKLFQANMGGYWLRFIHDGIISSPAKDSPAAQDPACIDFGGGGAVASPDHGRRIR